MICKYCKQDKKILGNHVRYCHENPNRVKRNSGPKKGSTPWNKGLHGIYSEDMLEKLRVAGTKSTGKCSDPVAEADRKLRISSTMKKNPLAGGIRKGSGRGSKGWYKGIWSDSSWELAWIIYAIDHKVKFERNWKQFKYKIEEEIHSYIPDFYLIDNNEYIEVKGRRNFQALDQKNKEKISQFENKLTVLYEKQMIPIISYVIEKYGKDFITLYENGR